MMGPFSNDTWPAARETALVGMYIHSKDVMGLLGINLSHWPLQVALAIHPRRASRSTQYDGFGATVLNCAPSKGS